MFFIKMVVEVVIGVKVAVSPLRSPNSFWSIIPSNTMANFTTDLPERTL